MVTQAISRLCDRGAWTQCSVMYAFDMTEGPVPIMAYLQSQDGSDVARQFLIEENIYRPMASGVYEGEDGRTLLDEAISWWAVQLDAVDRLSA